MFNCSNFLLLKSKRCYLIRFRGFYSRKYVHDFYARKEYLRQILEQNQKTIQQMNAYGEETRISYENEQMSKENTQCRLNAAKLHHLLSTKSVPGVYNGVTTKNYRIGNVKVDDYIKYSCKETIKEKLRNNRVQKKTGK